MNFADDDAKMSGRDFEKAGSISIISGSDFGEKGKKGRKTYYI